MARSLPRSPGLPSFPWLVPSLVLLSAVGLAVAPAASRAQTRIALDGTLPNGRTDDLVADQSGPHYTVDQSMGEATGGNLLQSLLFLSVGGTDEVEFTAVDPFDNLVIRVTGGEPSIFNGTFRSTVLDESGSGAHVFLMNPSGVTFATNSSIDVPGDLHVSTADYLRYDTGQVLDLRDPQSPVLTAAAPEAFGFLGGADARDVTFEENSDPGFLELGLEAGRTLGVAAGDVNVRGGSNASLVLSAPGGKIAFAAMGSAAGEVAIDSFDATTPDAGALGAVRLSSGAFVTTVDLVGVNDPQGEIVIRGGELVVDGGVALAGGDPVRDGEAIDVDVSDRIEISDGGALISSALSSTGSGDIRLGAGDVILVTGTGSGAFSQLAGSGPGGDVVADAAHIVITAQGEISATVENTNPNAVGPGGDVVLRSGDVLVASGGRVRTASGTSGIPGDVHIEALGLVVDGGQIAARGSTSAAPGAIVLDVDQLLLRGAGGSVTTINTADVGVGGDILVIDAAAGVEIKDGGLLASESGGAQVGGRIDIETTRLAVTDGGVVQTTANAAGDAGSIVIAADDVVLGRVAGATPGLLGSFVAAGALGDGGSIALNVGALQVLDGGQISTTTDGGVPGLGGGDAGSVTITAQAEVLLEGDDGAGSPSGVFAQANSGAVGVSGTITITAGSIRVRDGAEVSTRGLGTGSSGAITLTATDDIEVSGFGEQGSVVTARGIDGGGGDVLLHAATTTISGGGSIDVSTGGSGSGGLLQVRGGELVVTGTGPDGVLPSALAAEATADGAAVGIDIDVAGDVTVDAGAEITAISTGSGTAGDIQVAGRNVRIGQGANVAARALGSSDAGSIDVTATRTVGLDGGRVTTESVAAFGGNVLINAPNGITAQDGTIETSVQVGAGNGGDVRLESQLLVLNSSRVIAGAFAGNGGNINIDAHDILRSGDSVVHAKSELGISGDVVSASPEADLAGQTAVPVVEYLDASALLRRACASRTERSGSFVVHGHGGWEPPPDGPIAVPPVRGDEGCLSP